MLKQVEDIELQRAIFKARVSWKMNECVAGIVHVDFDCTQVGKVWKRALQEEVLEGSGGHVFCPTEATEVVQSAKAPYNTRTYLSNQTKPPNIFFNYFS